MKKSFTFYFLLLFTSYDVFAESVVNNETFTCKQKEIKRFYSSKYSMIDIKNEIADISFIEKKNLTVDKNNQVIEVWIVKLNTTKLDDNTSHLVDETHFGYSKILTVLDYKNMKQKELTTALYSCDGNTVISSDHTDENWKKIEPNSVGEKVILNTKKKGIL